MPERTPRDWTRLGNAMEARWTPERAAAVKTRIALRRQNLPWRSGMAVAVAVALLASGAALFGLLCRSKDTPLTPSQLSPPKGKSLPVMGRPLKSADERAAPPVDRSAIRPLALALTPGTRFTVEEEVSSRTYHVAEGIVRFDTGSGGPQSLVVRVGTLVIEDIGTVFTVEALAEERARVSVTEGRVRVTWPAGQAVVEAGEQGTCPPPAVVRSEIDTPKKKAFALLEQAGESWRKLARQGAYRQAFQIIEADPSNVLNQVDDLLLAADVMRFSGRPKQAASYLDQVVSGHLKDPRSDLAAFTLGRVFLDELGRPRQAAQAFAAAGRSGSPLAEEALAREVEAWSRAGDVDRARATAALYLKKYPHGPRADVVRAFGELKAR